MQCGVCVSLYGAQEALSTCPALGAIWSRQECRGPGVCIRRTLAQVASLTRADSWGRHPPHATEKVVMLPARSSRTSSNLSTHLAIGL